MERIKGHPSSSLLSVPSVLSEVKSISLRLGVSAVKILVAAEIIGIWDLIGIWGLGHWGLKIPRLGLPGILL